MSISKGGGSVKSIKNTMLSFLAYTLSECNKEKVIEKNPFSYLPKKSSWSEHKK